MRTGVPIVPRPPKPLAGRTLQDGIFNQRSDRPLNDARFQQKRARASLGISFENLTGATKPAPWLWMYQHWPYRPALPGGGDNKNRTLTRSTPTSIGRSEDMWKAKGAGGATKAGSVEAFAATNAATSRQNAAVTFLSNRPLSCVSSSDNNKNQAK